MKSYITILVAVLFVGCFGLSCFAACPSADWTGDCYVDFEDFAVLASQWDGNDFTSVAVFAEQWLTEGIQEIIWVSINDSGAGMKDENGNPINQGGFNGQMSKYETTNAQYCQYLNAAKAAGLITVYYNVVYATSDTNHLMPYFSTYPANSYSQITYSSGIFSVRNRDGYSMANHPVGEVSWYGATAFCNYYGYRLPTEWEWQAVADYDGSYIYGCGTSIDTNKANYNSDNPLGLTSWPYTTPVGYYPAYGYGMCDMAGNVLEWTSTVSGSFCVIRGGSWYSLDYTCTVSNWYNSVPNNSSSAIGFRVCR